MSERGVLNRFIIWVVLALSSLSVFIIPLIKFNKQFIARDWTLYNCMSYFSKSSWLYYKTLPNHIPYVLGGYDLLASPQSKVFSPLAIFDLFLSAPFASLFSLITLSIIGSYGMFKLLCYLDVNASIALLCAFIYAHASWFSLHFSEGHVVFGSFQLMGWMLYFTLQLDKAKYKIYLGVLLAFMVLDGGMYAFIYSLILVIFSFLFAINNISISELFKSIKLQIPQTILAVFIFLGLAGAKMIPLLTLHRNRIPVKENIQLDFESIINAFFNPNQHININLPNAAFNNYGIHFHEIGAYIGVISFIIILYYLLKNFHRKIIPYLLFILFFLWIGCGFGGKINPWSLFQEVPIINNAHIQTRVLFFVYFMMIILLAFSLNFLVNKFSKWKVGIVFLILTLEALIVPNVAFYNTFQEEDSITSTKVFKSYLQNSTIKQTVGNSSVGWGKNFELFEKRNVASRSFMDNAIIQGEIKTVDENDYQGEAYFLKGKGNIQILSYTPQGLIVNIEADTLSEIQFNTNFLSNWSSSNSMVSTFERNGLLTIKTDKINDIIELKYAPKYLKIILPFYILSVLLFLIFLLIRRNKLSDYFP